MRWNIRGCRRAVLPHSGSETERSRGKYAGPGVDTAPKTQDKIHRAYAPSGQPESLDLQPKSLHRGSLEHRGSKAGDHTDHWYPPETHNPGFPPAFCIPLRAQHQLRVCTWPCHEHLEFHLGYPPGDRDPPRNSPSAWMLCQHETSALKHRRGDFMSPVIPLSHWDSPGLHGDTGGAPGSHTQIQGPSTHSNVIEWNSAKPILYVASGHLLRPPASLPSQNAGVTHSFSPQCGPSVQSICLCSGSDGISVAPSPTPACPEGVVCAPGVVSVDFPACQEPQGLLRLGDPPLSPEVLRSLREGVRHFLLKVPPHTPIHSSHTFLPGCLSPVSPSYPPDFLPTPASTMGTLFCASPAAEGSETVVERGRMVQRLALQLNIRCQTARRTLETQSSHSPWGKPLQAACHLPKETPTPKQPNTEAGATVQQGGRFPCTLPIRI